MKSVNEKYQTVIEKNTFYFFNPVFEEKYEGYLESVYKLTFFLFPDMKRHQKSRHFPGVL